MSTKNDPAFLKSFDREMLRARFRSLFWNIFSKRKADDGLTMQAFADRLGVHKSAVSRGFSDPQNWTIDKLADMAEALGVELVIEARDAKTGRIIATDITISKDIKKAATDPLRIAA